MRPLRAVAAAVAVALAIACFLTFDLAEALIGAAGCALLAAITVTDLERRIIPNRIVVPGMAAAVVAQTARDPSIEWLVAALAAGGVLFVAALVYPAGMGMGDVKLAAFLGAWLGRDVVVAMFVGIFAALLPAVVILVRHGRAGRKMGLPFGPFLALGGVLALFAGEQLLDWYLEQG